jgi:ribosomal protein S18 acetylase RimI-like enzyme
MVGIVPFDDDLHRDQVAALWETVFGYAAPHNAPSLVIDRKLAVRDELFFVATVDGAVVGTILAGYDGHRGWLYAVAVDPAHRYRGIGSALVGRAERALTERGCVKINLQIADGNEGVIAFYAALGYAVEKRTSMGKPLEADISIDRWGR